MDRWLQSFAYRTTLGLEVFLIAAVVALIIAGLTVSYHALKAAVVNPVKSLRSE
jgi:putative ABC transport system permease protein